MSIVEVRREPPLRIATLDNGPRNIMTLEAVDALGDVIAEDAEAPVVVLAGRSDGFCSGLDNKTLAGSAVEREELLTRMGDVLLQALSGPTRLVLACQGHAVAAGAMLLLVADLRIAAPGGYKVGFTEPRLGMSLPELPAVLAEQRLDRRRLHELTVLGRIVGPDEATAAGFFDQLVETDQLESTAIRCAREIATLSDKAYRGSLQAVWGAQIDRLRAIIALQHQRREAVRAR